MVLNYKCLFLQYLVVLTRFSPILVSFASFSLPSQWSRKMKFLGGHSPGWYCYVQLHVTYVFATITSYCQHFGLHVLQFELS